MPRPFVVIAAAVQAKLVLLTFAVISSACAGAPPSVEPAASDSPLERPQAQPSTQDAPAPERGGSRVVAGGPPPAPDPPPASNESYAAPRPCDSGVQNQEVTVHRLVELACRGRFQIEASVVQLIPCPKCPPGPALCDQHCMNDRVQVADNPSAAQSDRLVMDLQVQPGVLSQLEAGRRYLLTVDSLSGYAGTLVRIDRKL